jgi:hypothetical protein
LFLQSDLLKFLEEFLREFYWEIILGIIVFIVLLVLAFWRSKIRKWRFSRKVKPKLDKALSIYEKIIPEYVTAKPKIKVIEKTEEIPRDPRDQPFGYIFVREGEEELIWKTIITFLPVSSSLRRIKMLFDEDLRRSLFDLLSYELGMKLEKENVALNFRDNALKKNREDFQAMERVYEDRKLTLIILSEASLRYRRNKGNIPSSEVEEFSTLVRKIAKVDATVVRIGRDSTISAYTKEILASKRGVVLLARGKNVARAIEVSQRLQEEGYTKILESELGLTNPETGMWQFVDGGEVSFIRIWLQLSGKSISTSTETLQGD